MDGSDVSFHQNPRAEILAHPNDDDGSIDHCLDLLWCTVVFRMETIMRSPKILLQVVDTRLCGQIRATINKENHMETSMDTNGVLRWTQNDMAYRLFVCRHGEFQAGAGDDGLDMK
jgi:hypothetical protein